MAEHVIKLPDVGEGVAEAELVEWHVKVGDLVREDAVLAAVMTDKATVEIPSPTDGEVVWLGAEIGDTVAVGAPLIRLSTAGEGASDAKAKSKGDEGDSKAAVAKKGETAPPAKQAEPTPAAKAKPQPEPAPNQADHAGKAVGTCKGGGRTAGCRASREAQGARGGRRPAPGFRQRTCGSHHP